MTSLKETLLEDMKKAMKEKNKKKLSTIRMARAAIKNEEINRREELNDDEIIEVLAKEVKKLRDSIADYEKAGKDETVAEIKQEIAVLTAYLPRQLEEEEIRQIVEKIISQTGAKDMSDMGKVMGAIMPEVKGKADGRIVNQLVREKLNH